MTEARAPLFFRVNRTLSAGRHHKANYAAARSALESPRGPKSLCRKISSTTATTSACSASTSRTNPSISSISTALQQPPGLQRPLCRKRRYSLQFADYGLRGHLGVEHRRRGRLRGDRRARWTRLRRYARLPHLPRKQRHDGLSRHDGAAPNRTPPRAQGDGIDLSALRAIRPQATT
jgi:hypothetical protein